MLLTECLCSHPHSYIEIESPMGWYLEAEPLGGNQMGRMEPALVGLVPSQEEARHCIALLLPYENTTLKLTTLAP